MNRKEITWVKGKRIQKVVALPCFVTAIICWLVAIWLPHDLYVTDRLGISGLIMSGIGLAALAVGGMMRDDGTEPYE